MPNVIYRVQVSGVEQARAQVASVPAAANASMASLSQRAGGLADAFKMVSRDIGTLGGSTAQAFTHMADEALSIVSILAGPVGIVSGIAAVGVAIGGLSALWQSEEAAMKRATDEKKAALDATRTLIGSIARGVLAEQKDATEDQVASLRAENEATDRVVALKRANLMVTERIVAADVEGYVAKKKMLDQEREEITALERANSERAEQAKALEKELEQRARMARQREAAEKRQREAEALRASQESARFRGEAGSIGGVIGARDDENRIARVAAAQKQALMDEADATRILRDAKIELSNSDEEAWQAERQRREERAAAWEEMEQQLIRERQLREEVAAANRAQMAQMVYASGVNASYSVGMYAVGRSIDFASSELMQFQDINRDNWRDMLQITEDTKAAFAARLQAFLFSTAIEAGKMAIWENAEGIKETALGAGALFTNPAEAASHFVSAGLHYAASAAYGTFAGGAAVGAGVVASQRGEGGLFASAPSGGGGYGSGGAGGGGGPSGGSYSGGGERGGGGPVVINITNEPGSMPPDDQDRAAMAVARHVRRAQQDWFTSQEMGG